jgi:fatty acid desaturase
MQKEKKYIIQGMIVLVLFLGIYTLLDYLNIGYKAMLDEYGLLLVVGNILLNIIMAFITAFMWNISTAMVKLTGKEGKGTFVSSFAVLFGMLTYGCTPCVIAFFSTIGITLAVAALPLAGLPYKLIALVLLIVGFFWLKYESNHVKCKIKN